MSVSMTICICMSRIGGSPRGLGVYQRPVCAWSRVLLRGGHLFPFRLRIYNHVIRGCEEELAHNTLRLNNQILRPVQSGKSVSSGTEYEIGKLKEIGKGRK